MTTTVEIKGSAAQQKAVISFMKFRKIPYVALGGEVDTSQKTESDYQCEKCFHVHLDYTDEPCVSCGCENGLSNNIDL